MNWSMINGPAWVIAVACAIDWAMGDPQWLPHPVVWMGKAAERLERVLRSFVRGPSGEYAAGVALLLLVAGGSGGLAALLLWLAAQFHPWLAWTLGTLLVAFSMAAKGLAQSGNRVAAALEKGRLDEARHCAGRMVSRSTTSLDASEVARAAVESVAENMVDAVVAPLFYAALGGPVGAVVYRAVNTLDAMVGYKNDTYRYFGWASARMDDFLNWIPARITGLLLVLAAAVCGHSGKNAWRVMRRDARKHPSPNGGFPEAAVAGALGIRLGGENIYHGRRSFRPYLGDPGIPVAAGHIRKTVTLHGIVAVVMMAIATGIAGVLR
jgi:adenosylcobinamide-phosphate synthase